jgi:hypothetical protein
MVLLHRRFAATNTHVSQPAEPHVWRHTLKRPRNDVDRGGFILESAAAGVHGNRKFELETRNPVIVSQNSGGTLLKYTNEKRKGDENHFSQAK